MTNHDQVTRAPVNGPVLRSLLSRRTVIAQNGERWEARGRIGDDPHLLVEIVTRYPGAVVLNALPIDEAVKLYNVTKPAC